MLNSLLELLPVVASSLDVSYRLGEDLGEDGHEGEDGGAGHELRHLSKDRLEYELPSNSCRPAVIWSPTLSIHS